MTRTRLAVWKFASCDGCQLALLDDPAVFRALRSAVDITYFLEAGVRSPADDVFDLSLVEGSISTPEDVDRIADVRRRSRILITIGACATAGGGAGASQPRRRGNVGSHRVSACIKASAPADVDTDRGPRACGSPAPRVPD